MGKNSSSVDEAIMYLVWSQSTHPSYGPKLVVASYPDEASALRLAEGLRQDVSHGRVWVEAVEAAR